MDIEPDEAIEQLADMHDADEDALQERYEEHLKEWREKGANNPEERAVRKVSLSLKGGSMREVESMRGIVIGTSDPINTSQSAVRRAKNYIENHGVGKAKQRGMIREASDGVATDSSATLTVANGDGDETVFYVIDSNENSPTSGEVLPAEDWIRYVHGIVKRNPDAEPHVFTAVLDADEGDDAPPKPPMYQPVAFDATWVGDWDERNTLQLRFPSADPFEAVDEGPDVVGILKKMAKPLADADSDSFGRNDLVVTKGTVNYMELSPDGDQSRRLTLVDPLDFNNDVRRTVWLAEHIEVSFASESEVFVIGTVSPSRNEEYDDSIEAVGVYPDPEYSTEVKETESVSETNNQGTLGEDDDDGGDPFDERIEGASYSELQEVASAVEEVPGSGIGADEMRERLVDALGEQVVIQQLESSAPKPEDGGEETEGPTDEAVAAAGGSGGAAEPSDEDEEWEW